MPEVTSRRTTLADVAKLSGVSTATVSYVLNQVKQHTIPAITRERVMAAADSLGYVPNNAATVLRTGKSRIVVLDIDTLPESPHLERFIAGFQFETSTSGCVLLVHHGHLTEASLEDVARMTSARATFGIRRYLEGQEVGRVAVDPIATQGGDVIQIEWLLSRGHRHLAFVWPENSPAAPVNVAERIQLFQAGARQRELPEPTLLGVPLQVQPAMDILNTLLVRNPAVTAVAAYNDETALVLLAACARMGLAVPGRLAIIGFDDSPHAELAFPALTSVAIDHYSYGRLAARHALGNEDRSDIQPFNPHVITRESA